MKAQSTYVQARPAANSSHASYSLPFRLLAIAIAISLVVSLCPLPSYAETNQGLPSGVHWFTLGPDNTSGQDSSAIAADSASATASGGDGEELATLGAGPLSAASNLTLGEDAIDPEAAAATAKEGDVITIQGTLGLIQTGTYRPPADADDKSVQFGSSSLSTAKIQQVKNRLNTAFMNPGTSGTAVDVDLSDFKIPLAEKDNLKIWIEDVINTNPDLFYMSSAYSANFSYSGGAFYTATMSVKYSMSASSIAGYRTRYENAMQTAMTWIPANANELQKVKAAHDYLVRTVAYHTQAAQMGGSGWQATYGNTTPWTAYGAFVDKRATCEGYSLAFMGILRRVGIDSTFVTQWQGNSGHGWNRVEVNNKWYNVDVTFDDPVPDRGSGTTPSTTYFMKSDRWFKANPTSGWHASWSPAGVAGTDTQYDSYSTSRWPTYSGPSSSTSNPTSLIVTTPANTKQSAPYTMLIDSRLQLAIGTTQSASVQPGRATWKSSNPSVVAVNSGGVVTTGKKTGSATITCKLGSRTAYCYIKVVASGTQMSAVSKSINWTGNTAYIGSNTVKYTGQNVKPKVNLTYQGKTLTQGKDYTLAYSSTSDGTKCIMPGTCTITIYGANGFIGTTTITYTIRADLAQCSINKPSVAYTGAAVKPVPTMKFKSTTLINGTDFTVTYPSNATSVGTKTATVRGKGAYTGTKTFTYTVKAASLANASVSYTTTHAYTGKAVKPAVTVKMSGVTLRSGTDYTLSYANNTKAGTSASITIAGKGNYTGKKTVYFTISKNGGAGSTTGGGKWTRLAGDNALATMQAITKSGFAKSDVVVIATNSGYWDALAASALAGKHNAPVLLTSTNKLSNETASEIRRLGATKAFICGGTAAVSSTTERQIRNALSGAKSVTRLAGSDALNTAVKIGNQVGTARSDTCIVATAGGYWDALAMAPYSYATKSPIYLVSGGKLNNDTLNAIRAGRYTKAIIAGGTSVVPNAVATQLKGVLSGSKSITRLAGENAYVTSGKIAEWELKQGMSANNMAIATAGGYWDALCGAAFCGSRGSVLVLADNAHRVNIDVFVKSHRNQIYQGYIFGGTSAVSNATQNAAYKYTKK